MIEATATVKFAVKPNEAPRIYSTISSSDASIYGRVIQPSLLKSLKSVFSKYELNTIATDWNTISTLVEKSVAKELNKFDYVAVKGLDLTGLKIAEEYRSAIEQKQIALFQHKSLGAFHYIGQCLPLFNFWWFIVYNIFICQYVCIFSSVICKVAN